MPSLSFPSGVHSFLFREISPVPGSLADSEITNSRPGAILWFTQHGSSQYTPARAPGVRSNFNDGRLLSSVQHHRGHDDIPLPHSLSTTKRTSRSRNVPPTLTAASLLVRVRSQYDLPSPISASECCSSPRAEGPDG